MKKLLSIFLLNIFVIVFSQTSVADLKKLSETEPDKALLVWKEVYNSVNDEDKIRSLLSVSQAYLLKGDQKNSFSYFEKAEKETERIDNPLLKSEILLHKSGIYAGIGLFDEAETYALEGIKVSKKIQGQKKNSIEGDLNYTLVTVRTLTGKEKNPIPIYQKILNLYQESDLPKKDKEKKILITYYNLGSLYLEKKIDSAEYYFKKITSSVNLTKYTIVEAVTYEKLGEIEYSRNNLENALSYLVRSQPLLKKLQDPNLASNYALLSAIYEKKGDNKKALEYKNLETTFQSSLNSSQRDALKKAFSSLEQNRKTAESKAETRTLIIWSLAIIAAITLAGLYRHRSFQLCLVVHFRLSLSVQKYGCKILKTNTQKASPILGKTFLVLGLGM